MELKRRERRSDWVVSCWVKCDGGRKDGTSVVEKVGFGSESEHIGMSGVTGVEGRVSYHRMTPHSPRGRLSEVLTEERREEVQREYDFCRWELSSRGGKIEKFTFKTSFF